MNTIILFEASIPYYEDFTVEVAAALSAISPDFIWKDQADGKKRLDFSSNSRIVVSQEELADLVKCVPITVSRVAYRRDLPVPVTLDKGPQLEVRTHDYKEVRMLSVEADSDHSLVVINEMLASGWKFLGTLSQDDALAFALGLPRGAGVQSLET